LQHELADKGVRIQAVLPGAVATDFWEISGTSYQDLPAEIVMSSEDVVDAALVGLDQGELVTIPPLQDGDEWLRWEAERRALSASRQFHPSSAIHAYATEQKRMRDD
jgi:uncharacterized protein